MLHREKFLQVVVMGIFDWQKEVIVDKVVWRYATKRSGELCVIISGE